MKVLIIGALPPPIGGVAIHIKRFFEKFKNTNELQLILFDIKKMEIYYDNQFVKAWLSIFSLLHIDVVHIHLSSNIKIPIAFLCKLFRKKVIYTHHNIRIKNIFIFKVFMLFVDKLILVNDKNISKYIKNYKYELIPAFLPSIEKTILPNLLVEKLKNYKNIISTNCFRLTFVNKKDLYGFDLCIDAFSRLVKTDKIKNTILVLVDPSGTTTEYVRNLCASFEDKNNCHIHLVNYAIDFNELTKLSRMVLRATRSDGDSLTIRESLYLNIPIIASDVTYRPDGTIIFRHEDSKDLSDKILDVIEERNDKHEYTNIDYGEEVMMLYKKFEK
ncbi:MAG: glycosyltransferase [Cellulophaga sp.]